MFGRPTERRRPIMERQYRWRDLAAVLGVYAILLQLGLSVVTGIAGGTALKDRAAAGESLAALAQEICSPAGLVRLAANVEDGDEVPGSAGPVCPGCLFAHGGVLPPTDVSDVERPAVVAQIRPTLPVGVAPAPRERIPSLSPRAPPAFHA